MSRGIAAAVGATFLAAPAVAQNPRPVLRPGMSIQALINGNEPEVVMGMPAETYDFWCQRGVRIRVEGLGSMMYRLLVVNAQGRRVTSLDSDGARGGTISLNWTCPDDALYRIGASPSFRAGERGLVSLTLVQTGGPAYNPPGPTSGMPAPAATATTVAPGATAPQPTAMMPQPAPAPQPVPVTGTIAPVGTIGMNQQVMHVLGANDARRNGRPIHHWSLACAAGTAFQLDILGGWDSFAVVTDPSGREVATDDDSGGNLAARVVHTCAMTGTYQLGVTTAGLAIAPGAYTLRVTAARPAALPVMEGKGAGAAAPVPQPVPAAGGASGNACPAGPGLTCSDAAGLRWAAASGAPAIRAEALGREVGPSGERSLYACRVYLSDGSVLGGKTGPGFEGCNVARNGQEAVERQYELLIGLPGRASRFASYSAGRTPTAAVPAYALAGQPYAICRAYYRGGIHPGMLMPGRGCLVTYGGQMLVLPDAYEVLVYQ